MDYRSWRANLIALSLSGLFLGAPLMGCAGNGDGETDAGGGGSRTDAGTTSGRDAGPGLDARIVLRDAGPPRDGGSARDAGPGVDPVGDAGPGSPEVLTFVVLGDVGEGNETQRNVAIAVRDTCAAEDGCDFAVLLGDNIYDNGVTSVTDPQWDTKFETPYADVDLPFYAVLGNHDYGGTLYVTEYDGLGNEWDKGPIEVQRTAESEKWTMPDTHYTLRFGNVGLVMLDTNSIMWGNTDHGDQNAWISGAVDQLRADGADWIIAAGHHPYRSNGAHGNAGNYEALEFAGIPVGIPGDTIDGTRVMNFYDTTCGMFDVSFSGHDHNLQWLNEPGALCGTELIVSGAGAKHSAFDLNANELHFGTDAVGGFMFVRITGDEFYGRFVDENGTTLFENTFTRTP